jgi:hypothetical protein
MRASLGERKLKFGRSLATFGISTRQLRQLLSRGSGEANGI